MDPKKQKGPLNGPRSVKTDPLGGTAIVSPPNDVDPWLLLLHCWLDAITAAALHLNTNTLAAKTQQDEETRWRTHRPNLENTPAKPGEHTGQTWITHQPNLEKTPAKPGGRQRSPSDWPGGNRGHVGTRATPCVQIPLDGDKLCRKYLDYSKQIINT